MTYDPIQLEEVDEIKNIKKTFINKIFAYFLIEIGLKLSPAAFKEVYLHIIYHKTVVFVSFFARALNEIGYQATLNHYQEMHNPNDRNELQNPQVKKEIGRFCEFENGELILLISNEFILELLPRYFYELGDKVWKQFTIFGSSDECLKNAVYITQHFSYWLYANKFTNSRLALFTDDE